MVRMTAYILEEVILEAQAARKALHDHLHHLMALEHEVQHLIPVNTYLAFVLQRYTQTHRMTGIQKHRQTDRQTDKRMDGWIDR